MKESHSYRTVIPPIADGIDRPFWSVMIPTYNCANYLGETLQSVLAQAPAPDVMQIEVIDDGSEDDPETIVKTFGQGRVQFYRQPQNVGHVRNFQTCLQRARGKVIHLLHGDDRVRDGFYRKLQQAFEQNPTIGAAYCRHQYMNELGEPHYHEELEQPESGILPDALQRLTTRCRIQTPSIAVRRDVYETLGAFDRRLRYCEDWEMWVRVAAQYPIWYEVETLADYRTHRQSITGRNLYKGQDIWALRYALGIMDEYLPREQMLTASGRHYYGLHALRKAENLISEGSFDIAALYIREALWCSKSWEMLRSSLRLLKKMLKQTLQEKLS